MPQLYYHWFFGRLRIKWRKSNQKLDLKGLCTKEQIFQYEDFSWGMDTEETFNQSSLNLMRKIWDRPKIAQNIYKWRGTFSWQCKANMNLEFSNDQLNQVSFTFYLEKDAKRMDSKRKSMKLKFFYMET